MSNACEVRHQHYPSIDNFKLQGAVAASIDSIGCIDGNIHLQHSNRDTQTGIVQGMSSEKARIDEHPQQQRSSPKRHGSGDTSESATHNLSPWSALSPADSTRTSLPSASRGSSSLSSCAPNWPTSPPAPLTRLDIDSDASQKQNMFIGSGGGAKGPLDSHSPTDASTRNEDYFPRSGHEPYFADMRGQQLPHPASVSTHSFRPSVDSTWALDDRVSSWYGATSMYPAGSRSSSDELWRTGSPHNQTTAQHPALTASRIEDGLGTPFGAAPDPYGPAAVQAYQNAIFAPATTGYDGIVEPEFSIFVGDLCPDLQEDDLVAHFLRPPYWPSSHPFAIAHAHAQQAQGIYSTPTKIAPAPFLSTKAATIMTDPLTGASRGFGFVRFTTEADCTRALLEMQGVVISPRNGQPGRPLRVCPATPKNRTSSSSSLLSTSTLSAIGERVFGAAALPQHQLSNVIAPLQSSPSAMPANASAGVVPPLQVGDHSARQYSASALDPLNTTVFVGGLSSLISEETLKTFFVPFGEIKYVKIPPGKGCGFVQFVRKMDAERAIERMQGFPIGGGRIRLSWGRSQGDKAAAAAATAATQAAQIGHLAGLAGLNPLTTSQLTAVTLANSAGLGSAQETHNMIVRRLTVAAATAAARDDDLAYGSTDVMSGLRNAADGMGLAQYRPQAPSVSNSTITPPRASNEMAAASGRYRSASIWPEIEPTPMPRSHTLSQDQLAALFQSVRLDAAAQARQNETFSRDSPAIVGPRERSHTFAIGSSPAQRLLGLDGAPEEDVSDPRSGREQSLPQSHLEDQRRYAARPGLTVSTSDYREHADQALMFQPFSPMPSPSPLLRQDPDDLHQRQATNSSSSEAPFKRYLEQQRQRELLRQSESSE